MLPVAPEFNRDSSQQAFVAPQSSHVDGKLWIQDVASTSVYRVDLKTGKFENFAPFKDIKPDSPLAGRPHSIYEIFPDAQNNLYIADFSDRAIGRIDAKTGEYTFVQTPTDRSRPRRGEIDKEGRLWFAEYAVDNVAMLDPKTNRIQEWNGADQVVAALPGQGRPERRRLDRRHGVGPHRADQLQDRRHGGVSAAGEHQYPQSLCRRFDDAGHRSGSATITAPRS